MSPFRSVGARLSFALAVVVIGALAIVWVALVPTLERRLEDGKLSELARSARAVSREAPTVGVTQEYVDDSARTLRPWIEHMPEQRAGERCVVIESEVPRGFGGEVQLLDSPLGARRRGIVHGGRREAVEEEVVGRMDGDELALQVC